MIPIATHFGPRIRGLFLEFPAIFPASASLIEKHETTRKREAEFDGQTRGRVAAGVHAAGSAMACVGLTGFAARVWKDLPKHGSWVVIGSATACWFLLSVALWLAKKSRFLHRRPTGRSAIR